MATLEQLKQALYNADQAGDFEAASTLAAAIQNMQSTVQGPPNRPGEVTPPKKEYTLGEQIIGGLEADAALFTGMTSGAVGYISGVIEGLGDQALKGQWKPEEILQTAEKGAAKFTYEPKTEAGKEITQRVGGMLTAADFMGPSPTGMFGDIIHPELTPAAAMAKGEQVIQKTAPIVKKAVPLVEKTIEKTTGIFKKELPKTQEEVTSVIQKASRGDKKAQQIIKEIAPFDKEAFDASQRLGIDLPISEFIKNDETAKTVGLSRSQVGSHEEAMFKQDVINTAKIADETIQALGNATDLATISEQVKNDLTRARQSLKDQERVLYTKVDESVPKDTYVNAPTLNDILTQTAKELGGEERLTASEKNLLALSRSETLTYGALLRVKNDIGGSLGKTSMFPDINEAQLGKIYNAIKEDQRLAVSDFAGENALADLQLANTLTVKRKALEDNIVSGFGRKGTGSISRLIENAIKSGSKGDVTNLNKLLSIVPIDMQRDVIATALKDLSTSKKAGNLGEFDFTNYAKTYEGLRQNAPIYNTVIKTIGEDKAQILQDLYSVSRTINEAKGNVLHTGKANQAILQTLKGNTIMQNIVGKIIGWGTQKLTAGLVSPDFLFKTPQDKLQAIADLMRNPDFKQMIVEAAKGKVNPETMAKVVKTDAYKAAAKDVRVEETPPQTVKQKVEAKRAEKAKPTKDEVKKKVEEKKAEKKPIDAKEEARKEIKNNEYLDAYKELILESGKATTKAERNKSHGWFDVTVKDDFGQDVATQRVAGQRDITEAFTADKHSIDRFMQGKATQEDLDAIKHDLKVFEASSDLRDEASIIKAKKNDESVELSDGTVYDPVSNQIYSKKEWQDLQDEALMFSKGEDYRMEHKAPRPEGSNIGNDVRDVWGEDMYKEPRAYQWYGHGENAMLDKKAVNVIKSMKDNPDKEITIYRAVPKGVTDINKGDWITTVKEYATEHGKNYLEKFDVISKKVKAKDIATDGNSIFEWGYYPESDVMFSKVNERLTEWHKDSAPETKNEDGTPKVFYHGTKANFDTFDIEKSNVGNYGTGFYFGENAEAISKHFADKPNSNIMPAYLKADNLFDATKINKPLVEDYLKSINAEGFTPNYEIRPFLFYKSIMSLKGTENFKKFIQSKGYDGIIGQTPAVGKQIVVFSPEQIKSIHNKGTFSESNPNILMSQFKTKNATTKQEAQTIAQNLLGKHYAKHADTFEIVQSVEELPQNIKDALYSVEAYHGTPHNVDRFSTKYIGTGEGAQAYGYGMYFADSKKVAEWYRDNLQGLKNEYKPKGYDTGEWWNQAKELYPSNKAKQEAWHVLAQGDFSKGKNKLIEWGEENAYSEASKKEIESVANQIYGEGNLYKVELKPKENEYLLWDKPLSEQSDYVKEKLKGKEWLFKQYQDFLQDNKRQGADIYYGFESITDWKNAEKAGLSRKEWRDIETSQQGASNYLHSLGIKGIKYLDNTSRGKGEGNHNYVIFKDEDIGVPEILKSGGKARGIFDPKSGKAYIIADAMKANEVEGVILHELLHKNINKEVKAGKSRAEAIMGSRYESVVKRLDNLYKMGDKQVKDAFQKVTDANTPAQHRIEEVMTYLLENITNESKPLLIKWKDDVIAAIKAFIAKTALQLGMKAETVMNKLNSKDIANILRSEAIKNESMLKNIKR